MASFFEKLKKGMGIEIPEEEIKIEEEEKVQNKNKLPTEQVKQIPKKRKIQKLKIEATSEILTKQSELPKKQVLPATPDQTETTKQPAEQPKKEKWFEPQGQLAVDVYQTDSEIVIRSTIAGVKPQDLDISIEADTVLINGVRQEPPEPGEKNYFRQECYWGPFSRQIILPEETDPTRAEAEMKEGILSIRIPKIERKKKRKIPVKI